MKTTLGTTALAAFARALPFATREEQAARDRTIVILKEITFDGSGGNGRATVVLENVGLGPARKVRVMVRNV